MSDDNVSEQSLIRVKADGGGVDLAIGHAVPGLLGRLLPAKFRLRRTVDAAISDRIIDKISRGQSLDDADLAFAEDVLSEQATRYVRLARIQDRAGELTAAQPPLLTAATPPAMEGSDARATSDDWLNKFREDASLVDDQVIREIYARVLAAEAAVPGAFNLRTLRALRYMDWDVATAFGRLQKVLLNGNVVPQQTNDDDDVQKVGLNHDTMLTLADAGLVNSTAQTQQTFQGDAKEDAWFLRLSGHSRIVSVRPPFASAWTAKLNVHLLTPAGTQLARIADCAPDDGALAGLLFWLKSRFSGMELAIASLPSRNWQGRFESLQWSTLEPEADQPSVAAVEASPRS